MQETGEIVLPVAMDAATNDDDAKAPGGKQAPLIFVIDDDAVVRDSLRFIFSYAGYRTACFSRAPALLDADLTSGACLVADIRMPEMDGLQLQAEVKRRGIDFPVILMTGAGDVPLAVRAMREGAFDFISKPFDDQTILTSVRAALEQGDQRGLGFTEAEAAAKLGLLTQREMDVFRAVVRGRANKVAAIELGISPRTVEVHRSHIMRKLKARSMADLVRIAMAAPPAIVPDP